MKNELKNNTDREDNYIINLPELVINGYKSDVELGKNATYSQYAEWYLQKLGIEAADKAKYARIGFAPLTYKASDTSIIEGDSLNRLRRQFGDTIKKRREAGLYESKPHIWNMDSTLYERLSKPMSGFSCINSQTSYYGPRFANKSNIDFQKNHFGFKPVSLDSLRRGDIIQLRQPWAAGWEGFRPFHAVMFDSYDRDGDVNVWNQHGDWTTVNPELVTYLHKSEDIPGKRIPRAMNAYRFIGDEKTEEEIRKGYEAYRKRNNLQD